MSARWFYFDQNNSGGSFVHDEMRGIGLGLFIEAESAESANDRAENVGVYFNGCNDDRDCACCGDRWSSAWGEGDAEPNRYSEKWRAVAEGEVPDTDCGLPLYIHPLNGPFSVAREVSP